MIGKGSVSSEGFRETPQPLQLQARCRSDAVVSDGEDIDVLRSQDVDFFLVLQFKVDDTGWDSQQTPLQVADL